MASAIEDIIDELEEYIDSCKPSSIFSDTKIVVNRDDIDGLLEELRRKTPDEIRRYQKIISNQEAILNDAKKKAKKQADDANFHYSDGILTYVDVDVVKYSEKLRNRAVRKNVTLPYWLNEKAEEMGINFSRVLQDALLQAVEG